MTVLDYILDGIEAELALERELGVRSVECNRELVGTAYPPSEASCEAGAMRGVPRGPQSRNSATALSSDCGEVGTSRPTIPHASPTSNLQPASRPEARNAKPETSSSYDFVFLHDRALSADGVAMMAKIITAMGKTPESAPIVFGGELPKAKAYVVLGGNALKKWFPGVPGALGQWIPTTVSPNVLVTYSPAYILRFGMVTPAVQKLKREMWQSLKSVLQRIR